MKSRTTVFSTQLIKDSISKIFVSGVLATSLLLAGAASPAKADNLWKEGSDGDQQTQIALPSFAPIIEKLAKCVVNISIEGKEGPAAAPFGKGPGGGFGGGDDQDRFGGGGGSPFDYFFQYPPDAQQGRRSFSSLGSGFVINSDGYIVTNAHVVERATKITVSFKDDPKGYPAKVIGRDKKTDLALLKVSDHAAGLEGAVLGNSDKLLPGDWVIAIGNPFRLGHTATVGIVSAKSRRVAGGGPYDDFIQTDASINPGNSGGPLFNARGEVIGINTAIFSPNRIGGNGFNIGIGFATPINMVKDIVSQLADKGKVVRGWLGVLIQPVSEDVASAFNLNGEPRGALVADVMDKSPAAEAGVKHGDIIIEFDGKPVKDNDDLPLMVARTELGKTVDLEVIRDGSSKHLSVKIRELKEEEEEALEDGDEEDRLGLTVQDVTPDIAKSLGLDEVHGVVVTNVAPDSVAEQAGLRRGDVIMEIAREEVGSASAFKSKTRELKRNKPLLLLVKRGGNTIYLTVKLE